MVGPLVVVVVAVSLALAAWAAWYVLRDRAVVLRQLWGAGIVVALLLAQAVVVAVLLTTGRHAPDLVVLWGYVLTQLCILPVAAAWAFAERTRWSSVVLLVAALTVVVLEHRLVQIWAS